MDISKVIAIAVEHHMAGRLAEAESLYLQALAIDQNSIAAWHLLGRLAHQTANRDVAIKYIQNAIDRKPDYAEAYCDQGAIFSELGRIDAAETAYRRAIEVKPSIADAHYNLGHLLQQQRRLKDAVDCYRRALELNPTFEQARQNLGIALEDLKSLP
jgi:tetratricopeptide (TPR) repeat protein